MSSQQTHPEGPSSAINRSSVDEVIVRVETGPGFPAGSPARHASRTASVQLNRMSSHQQQLHQSNGISGGNCQSQERGACEETINDAIWEEVGSAQIAEEANLRSNSTSLQECSIIGSQPCPRLFSEGLPSDAGPSAELRRCDSEPQRRSVDLDIHINEPDIVLLQDNPFPCRKPPSYPFSERALSLRAQKSGVKLSPCSAQRAVRGVSSPISIDPPQSFPAEQKLTGEEEEEEEGNAAAGQRKASEAESLSLEKRTKLLKDELSVKLRISDQGQGNTHCREGEEDGEASKASAATCSLGSVEKRSKELVKTRTKSRLVEVSLPSSPLSAPAPAASGRFSEAEKKHSPQSPVRTSARRADTVGEEDPFKDIDSGDEFRQGKVTPISIAQWVVFVVVMGCLISSVTVGQVKERQVWGLDLWKWFLLVLVVLCGRLVSGWLIRILVIIIEQNFLLRKKVMYFVYGLRKGVQNCLWLGLVVLAWKLMFDPQVARALPSYKVLLLVTKLLECFLIAAFIWLVKILLIKSLASSFHVNTFFDRIQESLFHQHVLEALSGPPLVHLAFEPLRFCGTGPKPSTKKDPKMDPKLCVGDLQKVSTHNVSAGLMKRLMHLVKHPGFGYLVTTLDESAGVDQDSEDIKINSELEAKAAAKRIFENVAQKDSMSIEREDLLRFVTSDEVEHVLCLFEGSQETGKITKEALKNWVVNVYQERKALAHSLNDTKTAVKELHRMVSVVVSIIIIVVWLLILGIATTKVLVFGTSQLLLAGFIFSNTMKQVFEAIIFLFVMHPFDVGDRCIVDGVQMVVEEMKILSTVFLKVDNEKVFYPNSVLATKPISNLYRSPNMKDVLNFSVHISTPTEKISALKDQITVYVAGKSEQWHPKFSVVVTEVEDMNRMRLSVTMQHTINFQNSWERLSRRSELLLELKRMFTELGIEYRLVTQPVLLTSPSPPPPPSELLPFPIYPAQFP